METLYFAEHLPLCVRAGTLLYPCLRSKLESREEGGGGGNETQTQKILDNVVYIWYNNGTRKGVRKIFWCLIAGARDWNDYATFSRVVTNALSRRARVGIITGGATGTDTMAIQYAIENGLPCRVCRADWRRYGLAAGWQRNMEMHQQLAQYPREKRGCLCFWNGRSGGTAHNFKLAAMYDTPLRIYSISASKFI